MSLLTHMLACMFGMGSWVTICGLWVELPLIVPQVPEGWYLPSYLSVLTQIANIGPLFVTLMHRFQPGKLNETAVIYFIVSFGVVASLLLAFFWKETVLVQGVERSLYLLLLTFFISIVDCTSSVTFLPFMMRLRPVYLTTYYIGEGLSGLIPALVALIQGVGSMKCVNGTHHNDTLEFQDRNESVISTNLLIQQYLPANFSVDAFFIFLAVMMFVCLVAFLLLNCLPTVAQEHTTDCKHQRVKFVRGGKDSPEQENMMNSVNGVRKRMFGKGTYSWPQVIYIFIILAWVNALTNSVLLSVQSYSCLPYGNHAYHWSATLAAVANPLACFIAMFYPQRSLVLMGLVTASGSVIGVYIMGMAVLSPCPLLVNHISGAILIVVAWMLFVLILSYVKVIVAIILRDEGHSALVWCGAVVQLGSLFGAVIIFPLVNVYNLFSSGDPCNVKC